MNSKEQKKKIAINDRQLEPQPPASESPGTHLQTLQLQITFALGATMRTRGRGGGK